MNCRVSARRPRVLLLSSALGRLALVAGLTLGAAPGYAYAQAAARIHLPAQPLGSALSRLANQYSLELAYAPDIVAGRQAAAISGTLTADDALSRLLKGTGIRFSRDGNRVSLARAEADGISQLDPVRVRGTSVNDLPPVYAGGQVARGGRLGLLGNRDVMDAPFSVTSYTSEWLTNRQAVTLADALNLDSSVRFTGQIGGVTDSFTLRGFPISEGNLGEIAFDGVYGVAPNYHVFTDYIERVEVLKGPAALLYGMSPNSGVGGVINMVPKRSLPQDLTRVTADYAGASQFGGRVDLSRRFGRDGAWGVRVNGRHRQGGAPLDHLDSRADIGALSLDYQGERLRASLDLLIQNEKVDAPTRPFLVAAGLPVPDAPDGRRNATQPWGWWRSDGQSALLRVEYDVSERLTVFADAGGSDTAIDRLSDQTPMLVNAAGDTRVTPNHFKFQIDRSTYNAGLRAKFDTGPVRHAVHVMGTLYSDRNANASVNGAALSSNIYRPVTQPRQDIAAPVRVPKVSSSDLSGFALADTLSALDERVQLTLGLRQQRIVSRNFNAATGARALTYDESAVTPLTGLVFKPWRNVSLYANYIEGLSKGDVAPATASNAGQVLEPYRSRQKEAGVKFDGDSAMLTLSVFEITKPSGQLTGTVYAADSEQRNRGVELNLSGEPLRGLRLLGGMTFLDAALTRTGNRAALGNQAVGAPRFTANLAAEWDMPWVTGMSVTGSVIHTSKEYVDQANTQAAPSWTTFDLGARYAARIDGKAVILRASVVNLFNRAYWSGVASYGTLSQGVPRTFMLSASMDF